MSSMTTKVTIVGDEKEVNPRKAALNGIKMKEVNGKVLCETTGVMDTGADTNCTDKKLRGILGRDALDDAGQALQGCTGSSDDMKKDKLRIVCVDKQITVVEARRINELGYNGPNSETFMESMKTEFKISPNKTRYFDFNDEGVTPRILVGLKSGELLSNQLTEAEMLELELEKPYFSPNLKIWRTPLNSKLLVTGSLGIDRNLVELESNYPRFQMLVKQNEMDGMILKRIMTKAEKLLIQDKNQFGFVLRPTSSTNQLTEEKSDSKLKKKQKTFIIIIYLYQKGIQNISSQQIKNLFKLKWTKRFKEMKGKDQKMMKQNVHIAESLVKIIFFPG